MKTLLIIEDDQDFATILQRSFERRDYEVRVAAGYDEMVSLLKKFHPRYVVVDLKMSGKSGLDCIDHIHTFDKAIKIVMLTGYASITTTIDAIKRGACYYLAKPANAEMIIAAFEGKESTSSGKKTSLKNLEWEHIHQTLSEVNFNISKAAKLLGMHRRTLARKLEKVNVK